MSKKEEKRQYWRIEIPHPAPSFTGVDKRTGIEFQNSICITSDMEHIRYARSITSWVTKELTKVQADKLFKAEESAQKIGEEKAKLRGEMERPVPIDLPEIGDSPQVASDPLKTLDFAEPEHDPNDDDLEDEGDVPPDD